MSHYKKNIRAASFAIVVSSLVGGLPVEVSAQEADAQAGKIVFNNSCRTCHTLKPGDARLGPDLAGIIGRKAGAGEGYSYSSAMKNAGITWDEANLDRFIADPNAVIPNNNMKPYTGMSSESDRKNLIAYLKAGDQ